MGAHQLATALQIGQILPDSHQRYAELTGQRPHIRVPLIGEDRQDLIHSLCFVHSRSPCMYFAKMLT